QFFRQFFLFFSRHSSICLYLHCFLCIFFFFSSRRRHTRFKCDWSSDVCSSDLSSSSEMAGASRLGFSAATSSMLISRSVPALPRSEERRVGKEWRYWWSREY